MLACQVKFPLIHVRLVGNIGSGKSDLVEKIKKFTITPQLIIADEPMECMESHLRMIDSGRAFSPLTVQLGMLESIRRRDTSCLEACCASLHPPFRGGKVKIAHLLTVRGVEDVQSIFTRVNRIKGVMTQSDCSVVDAEINVRGGIRPSQGLIWIACGELVEGDGYRARLSTRNQHGDKFALNDPKYLSLIEREHLVEFANFDGPKLRLECDGDPDENCDKALQFLRTLLTTC